MFYVDLVVTRLYKYCKANWMARLLKGDLDVCESTISKTGPTWIRMLPSNELPKTELIEELAYRWHVELMIFRSRIRRPQKMTAD